MRKTDAVPPVFVDGEPLEPQDGLRRWLEERLAREPRATLRLPFTFGAEPRRAALGLPGPGEVGWLHRLDDAALGVALDDRLHHLRGGSTERRAVWLSVRLGAPLPPPRAPADGDLPVASVLAVHEPVADGASPRDVRAQAARCPDDLAVRLLRPGHCARGPARCARCRAAAAGPPALALLDLAPDGPAARPTIGVARGGRTTWAAYDVLRWFASRDEATAFAARHAIADARLDEAEA